MTRIDKLVALAATVGWVVLLAAAAVARSDQQPVRPAPARPGPPAAASGCISCHTDLADAMQAPVRLFEEDVHRDRGFSCVDCHGGDGTVTEKDRAKDPARGYRGRPVGMAEVETCARCHSDAAFMRRFMPRQRVDQAAEYAVSAHGRGLAAGDLNVATCSSCHRAHGIRLVTDARAPIYPLNVAATCARCHSDPEYMAPYGLPADQQEKYERSVHHAAMVARHDLSAPTCNDCHGNHGAAPPGVDDVANVCGTCHAVFQMRYERSVHSEMFGCSECHSNHAVLAPSDELLGASETAICSTCHAEGETGLAAAAAMRAQIETLKESLARARALTDRAQNAGMEMGDAQLKLGEARNQLTLARTEVHSFDPADVETVVAEGLDIVTEVEVAGQDALAELRFRRQGLAVSLVAILLLVIGLALKIRELDRRAGVHTGARTR
jgi:predicted CXXCH cytochrome family protein